MIQKINLDLQLNIEIINLIDQSLKKVIRDQTIIKINDIKIFYSTYIPQNIKEFHDKQIIAFAGIGNPSNFFDLLKENKIQLMEEISYPDHYNYSINDINTIINQANNFNCKIITTEKDYLRLDDIKNDKIKFIKSNLEITDEEQLINTLILKS